LRDKKTRDYFDTLDVFRHNYTFLILPLFQKKNLLQCNQNCPRDNIQMGKNKTKQIAIEPHPNCTIYKVSRHEQKIEHNERGRQANKKMR